jgi:hypothetical protein
MIKWLVKSTNEIRIETKSEVDEFHKQLQDEADEMGCRITSWQEAEKQKKAGGEVVEEWFIVKYTLTFNDPKNPDVPLKSIEYNMINGGEF